MSRQMLNREVAVAVLRRPRLWPAAAGAAMALAPSGWWRRRPFMPLPDDELIRWRVATAYGADDAAVAPADVVAYLEWRQRYRQG